LLKQGRFSINHAQNIQKKLSSASVSDIMSKMTYVKTPGPKEKEISGDKPLTTSYGTLMH
jgi:hypothetical protein